MNRPMFRFPMSDNLHLTTRTAATMRTSLFGRILLAAALMCSLAATAQEYPVKPIKIVMPTQAGGSSDRVARLLAEKLRLKWGQTVTVENRAGAGGNIGAEYVAKAPPDGYTLLFTPQFPLVVNKSLYTKLAFDPDQLTPITVAVAGDMVLVAHPKSPFGNVQQLIDYMKANPDRLSFASPGSGSIGHLMMELFNSMSGGKSTHIPYKGSSPALSDVLGGQVDIMFVDFGSALPHIRAGKLRAYGIASEKRNAHLPEVPTIAEVMPEFVFTSWFGMVAPPGTPQPIAEKLSAAVAEALRQPDVAKRLAEINVEAVASTPAEMARIMKRDRELWAKVIRSSNTRAD
jgi:tripartite-type tricarboxylate transporter receptor subunit TctC